MQGEGGGASQQQGEGRLGLCDEGHHDGGGTMPTLNCRKNSDLDGTTLKEQLANKVRGSSSIPGSFYERDIEFKSKAFEDRKAAVCPRKQGLCQYVMYCVRDMVDGRVVASMVCVCVQGEAGEVFIVGADVVQAKQGENDHVSSPASIVDLSKCCFRGGVLGRADEKDSAGGLSFGVDHRV